ncbi:MAG: filamentous hemagglutinin N-terminal domain-containing protein, partial [Verrucomicrobiales bacterium]|nr:filamentous hemagglutinin N-terminal domain-containing protein [Verrucomicrobiales bacterium]
MNTRRSLTHLSYVLCGLTISPASVALAADLPVESPNMSALLKGQLDRSVAGTLTINLNAATHGGNNIVLDWTTFDIAAKNRTLFSLNPDMEQGGTMSILNRVGNLSPSLINGELKSFFASNPAQTYGDIYIVNPAGIIVGAQATINVGSLFLSTLSISDADWKNALGNNGKFLFSKAAEGQRFGLQFELTDAPGAAEITVEKGAKIQADKDAFLVGERVKNAGEVTAGRYLAVAAGNTVEISQFDQGNPNLSRVSVKVGGANVGGIGIENQEGGLLEGAITELRASGGNVFALAISNNGRTSRKLKEDGRIAISAKSDVAADAPAGENPTYGKIENGEHGVIEVPESGSLTIEGSAFDGSKGEIKADTAAVDVSIKTVGADGGVVLGKTSGHNIKVDSGGKLELADGRVEAGGNLELIARGGDVTQQAGSEVSVKAGKLIIDAGANNVSLLGSAAIDDGKAALAVERLTDVDGNVTGLRLSWSVASGHYALERRSASGDGGWMDVPARKEGELFVADIAQLGDGELFRVVNLDGGLDVGTVEVKSAKNLQLATRGALKFEAVDVSGNLAATAGGAITQSEASVIRVAGESTLASRGTSPGAVTLENKNNDFGGAVSVPSAGRVNLADANALRLGAVHTQKDPATADPSNGELKVFATGDLDQKAGTILKIDGTTSIEAGGAVDLANANEFQGSVTVLKGKSANLASAGGLELGNVDLLDDPTTVGVVEGNLSVASGGPLSQSGGTRLKVDGTTTLKAASAAGAAQTITLDNENEFGGAVSITDAGATSLRAKAGLELGSVSVRDADLTLKAGGNVSQGAGSTISVSNGKLIADVGDHDVSLLGGGSVGVENVPLTLDRQPNGFRVSWDTAQGSYLLQRRSLGDGSDWVSVPVSSSPDGLKYVADLAGAAEGELFRLVSVGKNNVGALEVRSAANFRIATGGPLRLEAVTVSKDFVVDADGDVTQKQGTALIIDGNASVGSGGSVHLANANDFKGSISVPRGRNADLSDVNELSLGTIKLQDDPATLADREGNLTVGASGNISQAPDSILNIGSATSFSAGTEAAKTDIKLGEANDNQFAGAVSVPRARDIRLTSSGPLELGAVVADGALEVQSQGDIRQSVGQDLSVSGDAKFKAVSTDGTRHDVRLEEFNDFRGTVTVADASSLSVVDADAIRLGDVTLKKDLTVVAGGPIDQAAGTRLTVDGATQLSAANGQGIAQSIDLKNDNDFKGSVSVADAGDVTLRDISDLELSSITTRDNPATLDNREGKLSVTTGGSLKQVPNTILTVASTTTLEAGGAVELGNANKFDGSVSVTKAGNTTLGSAGNLTLGQVNASDLAATPEKDGNLKIVSGGGLGQVAGTTLVVDGTTTLGAAGIVVLENDNDFKGAVAATAHDVALKDVNNLELGGLLLTDEPATSTVEGRLKVTAAGDVKQQAGSALRLDGPATVNAGGAVDLSNANALKGAVSVAARDAKIGSAGVLQLGVVTLTDDPASAGSKEGNLTVTATQSIEQADDSALSIDGESSFAAPKVALGDFNDNQFRGAVSVPEATEVTLSSSGPLELGSLKVSGPLNISAQGPITDSTAANAKIDVGGPVSLNAARFANGVQQPQSIALDRGNNEFNGAVAVADAANVTLHNVRALELGSINARDNTGTPEPEGNLSISSDAGVTQSKDAILNIAGTTVLEAGGAVELGNANKFGGSVSVTKGGNVTLRSAEGLTLGAVTLSTDGGSAGQLKLTSGGAIKQQPGTALTVGGTTTLEAAGDVVLENADNNFKGTVAATGHDVALRDRDTIELGGFLLTDEPARPATQGNLKVTAANGVSQKDGTILKLDGATTVASGGSVDLSKPNQIEGTVSVSGAKDAKLGHAGVLQLGTVNLPANPGSQGTLTATAGQAITQTEDSSLSVGGDASFSAPKVALGDFNENRFGGAVSVPNAREATLTSSGALVLGNVKTQGELGITSAGPISQRNATDDKLDVGGVTTLAAGTQGAAGRAPQDITLNGSANRFGGAVNILEGRDANLQAANAEGVTLGKVLLGVDPTSPALKEGNLTVGAAGPIRQSSDATLRVPGTTKLTARSTGANGTAQNVTLDSANGNQFGGAVSVTEGRDVTLASASSVELGSINADGKLDVSAQGAITESKKPNTAIIVDGSTFLSAKTSQNGADESKEVRLDAADNKLVGPVSLRDAGDVTIRVNDALILGPSTVSGDALFDARKDISQQGGPLKMLDSKSTATFRTAAGSNIKLENPDNQFGTIIISSDAGTTPLDARGQPALAGLGQASSGPADVTIVDQDDLQLAGLTVSGDLDVTAQGKITQGTDSAITVVGSTTLRAEKAPSDLNEPGIILANKNANGDPVNNFGVLNIESRGSVEISDKDDIVLGAVDVDGKLNVRSLGAIRQNNDLSGITVDKTTTLAAGERLVGKDIVLENKANDFIGEVTATGAKVALFDKNKLTIGVNATDATLTAGGDLVFAATTVNGNLEADSKGAISQTGDLLVTGTSQLKADNNGAKQSITLTNTANDFRGSVTVGGAKVEVTDATALEIGGTAAGDATVISGGELKFDATMVKGNLAATSKGAITQAGDLTVDGTSQLKADNNGTKQAITLDREGNDFVGAVTADGALVKLTDSNTLTIGGTNSGASLKTGSNLVFAATTVNGNLEADSKGAISQTGDLLVTGTSQLKADNNGAKQSITLTNTANDFRGNVTVGGAKVEVTDATALEIGGTAAGDATVISGGELKFDATTVKGNLAATSKGAITQAGDLTVEGTSQLKADNNGTKQAITLDREGNDFVGAVTVDGGVLKLTDRNALTLGGTNTGATLTAGSNLVFAATTVDGKLVANSKGAISQTGDLLVTGTSQLKADNNGAKQSITLTNTANDFRGSVSVDGAKVEVT